MTFHESIIISENTIKIMHKIIKIEWSKEIKKIFVKNWLLPFNKLTALISNNSKSWLIFCVTTKSLKKMVQLIKFWKELVLLRHASESGQLVAQKSFLATMVLMRSIFSTSQWETDDVCMDQLPAKTNDGAESRLGKFATKNCGDEELRGEGRERGSVARRASWIHP